MTFRLPKALLAAVVLSSAFPAFTQTVIGRESAPARYNRLGDIASRGAPTVAPASPDVFGTAAVAAGVTFYDARFRRVAAADGNHGEVLAMARQLRDLDPVAQLAAAQSLVKQRVRYMDDLDNMKVSDLWSNAGETLSRGVGDSEDIAIVTMQVLKAAGFNARDLYLSIGRRKNVGAHIVLLARTPSGFYMLDDKIGHPLPARDSTLFTPVFTIGQGKSFIHGRRVGPQTVRMGGL